MCVCAKVGPASPCINCCLFVYAVAYVPALHAVLLGHLSSMQSLHTVAILADECWHATLQYYDDTSGILRNVILSAIAPHRMSASPMPLAAFNREDNAAGPVVLPMTSPLEAPMFSAFEDEVEDS